MVNVVMVMVVRNLRYCSPISGIIILPRKPHHPERRELRTDKFVNEQPGTIH